MAVDFESNIRLVYKVYNDHFQDCRWIEDDLIQEGMIGLWKACQAFDESRGVPFGSFAYICIRNSMGMLLRREARHAEHMNFDLQVDEYRATVQELSKIDEREQIQTSLLVQDVLSQAKAIGCYDIVQMKLAGMKQKDIAAKLGMKEVAVSEALAGAMKKIRENLK